MSHKIDVWCSRHQIWHILEMFWLHNRNSKIDWVNKKLYATEHTYEISEQSEMCLSEHKSWNHKISLEEKTI
jgi:hypothetical protein